MLKKKVLNTFSKAQGDSRVSFCPQSKDNLNSKEIIYIWEPEIGELGLLFFFKKWLKINEPVSK